MVEAVTVRNPAPRARVQAMTIHMMSSLYGLRDQFVPCSARNPRNRFVNITNCCVLVLCS